MYGVKRRHLSSAWRRKPRQSLAARNWQKKKAKAKRRKADGNVANNGINQWRKKSVTAGNIQRKASSKRSMYRSGMAIMGDGAGVIM